jgi:hypothetical protein
MNREHSTHNLAISLVAAAIIIILATAWLALAEEALPRAESIMDRNVEAWGGQEAFDRIHNRVIEGDLEIAGQGLILSVTISNAKPAQLYMEVDSELTGMVRSGVCDGVAWESSLVAGPQVKKGIERDIAVRGATFDKFVYWRSLFSSVAMAGAQQEQDSSLYRVEGTPFVGKTMILFFEKASGLLVRVETIVETAAGEVPVEARFEDYRAVDGVLLPHRLRTVILGQERIFTITSVSHNVELAEAHFTPPAEVLELLANQNDSSEDAQTPS